MLSIVEQLAKSDKLENFYKKKFSNKKRFGLEGADSLIPGLKAMIDEACPLLHMIAWRINALRFTN